MIFISNSRTVGRLEVAADTACRQIHKMFLAWRWVPGWQRRQSRPRCCTHPPRLRLSPVCSHICRNFLEVCKEQCHSSRTGKYRSRDWHTPCRFDPIAYKKSKPLHKKSAGRVWGIGVWMYGHDRHTCPSLPSFLPSPSAALTHSSRTPYALTDTLTHWLAPSPQGGTRWDTLSQCPCWNRKTDTLHRCSSPEGPRVRLHTSCHTSRYLHYVHQKKE